MKRKLIIAAAALLSCGSIMAQPTSWSEPQLLIKAEHGLMAPTWSPDGSLLAVTGDNFVGIWVSQADGTGLRQVSQAPGAGYQMRWESNQEIMSTPYSIENQKRMTRIERVNVATGKAQVVAPATRDLKRSAVAGATDVTSHRTPPPGLPLLATTLASGSSIPSSRPTAQKSPSKS